MYETNKGIKLSDHAPDDLKHAYNFLVRAFRQTSNPHLKKYAAIDLPLIASAFLKTFDLSNYPKEFAKAYLSFVDEYVENLEAGCGRHAACGIGHVSRQCGYLPCQHDAGQQRDRRSAAGAANLHADQA